jgi:hypothetical protein
MCRVCQHGNLAFGSIGADVVAFEAEPVTFGDSHVSCDVVAFEAEPDSPCPKPLNILTLI